LDIELLNVMLEKKTEPNEEIKITKRVKQLFTARENARNLGDWNESDRIRDLLRIEGWCVKDTPGGQILEKE
jgi:cysteinyl-tRNA synthetase